MKRCATCGAVFDGEITACPIDGDALMASTDSLIGITLGGRYLLVDRIGAGGMATVYRAMMEAVDGSTVEVAVKVLAEELACDPLQRERFLREARATHRVKHPNIVDVLDYGEDGGTVYLVMELLLGATLARRIASTPMAPREAVEVVMQVTQALARAHDVAIVHRDVKPENIFLCGYGTRDVKVLDFGLAFVRDEARLTVSGTVFGTPEYMSPEMARGAQCAPASDLYALGVTFFEMLTGRRPFDGTLAELIEQHLDREAPSLQDIDATLPTVLQPIVQKLLAKNLQDRYRDAHHLADDLADALATLQSDGMDGLDVVVQLHPTVPSVSRSEPPLARMWNDWAATMRTATAAVYPNEDAPAWVHAALQRLDDGLAETQRLRYEIRELVARLDLCERQSRATRERWTGSLELLAREESAALRELDDFARQRTAVRAQGNRALSNLLQGLDVEGQIVGAVEHARAWQNLRAEEERLTTAVAMRRQASAAVAVQIARTREKLSALDAAVEREEAVLRAGVLSRSAARMTAARAIESLAAELAAHLRQQSAGRQRIDHPPSQGPATQD